MTQPSDQDLQGRVAELLAQTGATSDIDQLSAILTSALGLARDGADRLDLKITNAALAEMREAFRVFAPFRRVPKVTIFGSARTLPADPLYVQARDLASALADVGWMVVTGAGPGIMAAGSEGAGRSRSIGVNIRLPFEQGANAFIAADPKLVSMKYFFTRKLMLIKESAGFAVLPGGFGTLDEAFELLTLLQTGKAAPAPIVLLDVPGGTYWQAWESFVVDEVIALGLVSAADRALYRITDNVDDATAELLGFFSNFHSMRYVGRRLVMRLQVAPTAPELEQLAATFADICTRGTFESISATPAEVASGDYVDLPRIALYFNRLSHGRLRTLIDAVNGLVSAAHAKAVAPPDPSGAEVPPNRSPG